MTKLYVLISALKCKRDLKLNVSQTRSSLATKQLSICLEKSLRTYLNRQCLSLKLSRPLGIRSRDVILAWKVLTSSVFGFAFKLIFQFHLLYIVSVLPLIFLIAVTSHDLILLLAWYVQAYTSLYPSACTCFCPRNRALSLSLEIRDWLPYAAYCQVWIIFVGSLLAGTVCRMRDEFRSFKSWCYFMYCLKYFKITKG
jgi:hypothetical protein